MTDRIIALSQIFCEKKAFPKHQDSNPRPSNLHLLARNTEDLHSVMLRRCLPNRKLEGLGFKDRHALNVFPNLARHP